MDKYIAFKHKAQYKWLILYIKITSDDIPDPQGKIQCSSQDVQTRVV